MKKFFLFIVLLPFFGHAQYKFYYNDRFEVSIKYPLNFKPAVAPGNNDGRTFFSEDKKSQIRCFGSYSNSDHDLNYEFKIYTNGIAVSYKVLKNNLFAFSGYDFKGNIYYQKSILRKLDFDGMYVVKTVVIVYPQNQKDKYDSVCKTVAASLK